LYVYDIVLIVGGLCVFRNERNTIYTVRNTEKVKRRWRNGSGTFLQNFTERSEYISSALEGESR
jgi:hypothetical protein